MRLQTANIPNIEKDSLELPAPAFLTYKPDFTKLEALWKEYGHFKNVLVIGHGGSVTSLIAMHGALGAIDKQLYVLGTVDPDYISSLKAKLPKHDTLVIAISKSGETVTQLEALMQFADYPLLFVTQKDSVLEKIGQKLGAKIVIHPPIGGRFTAFTEVAFVPAAILGMNVQKIFEGGQEFYKQYKEENIALQAARILWNLEQQGIVDVFMPFYSHQLFAAQNLIVQLNHESFGKNGKGQTYFAHEAPESQHHTNQRFFGGRKNIAGFFIRLEKFNHEHLFTHVPTQLHSIHLKDGSLYDLNKLTLKQAMDAEYNGTWEDAKINAIPILSLSVDSLAPKEIGAMIAFWQLFAVYSSVLRGVDPFDQPQVENSKNISWNKRKAYRLE